MAPSIFFRFVSFIFVSSVTGFLGQHIRHPTGKAECQIESAPYQHHCPGLSSQAPFFWSMRMLSMRMLSMYMLPVHMLPVLLPTSAAARQCFCLPVLLPTSAAAHPSCCRTCCHASARTRKSTDLGGRDRNAAGLHWQHRQPSQHDDAAH